MVPRYFMRNIGSTLLDMRYCCIHSGRKSLSAGISNNSESNSTDIENEEKLYKNIVSSLTSRWNAGDKRSNVFLIQPDFKYKLKKHFLTTLEYRLQESRALVEVLPGWRVIDYATCSIKYKKSLFFGPGQLSNLVHQVKGCHEKNQMDKITTIFISTNQLTFSQISRLKKVFQCDVMDRYTLVLEIFRRHAATSEAKLQVALAEVPYVRAKVGEILRNRSMGVDSGLYTICGPGETIGERLKRFLHQRESKLVAQLKKLEEQRSVLRIARQHRELPSVAIVGYTNAGKTCLTRTLSGDVKRLEPNDRLFATLDVTAHGGRLPCGLPVVYLDTIGFLSDLPTQLVAAFKSTLQDTLNADLILHVVDLSNPDWVHQRSEVLQTLSTLRLPEKLLNSIVEVGNKIDVMENDVGGVPPDTNIIRVSAKTGAGLADLAEAIEAGVLSNTGRRVIRLRIPTAGPHLAWLHHEHAYVATKEASDDGNTLIVDALFTEASYGRFQAKFGLPSNSRKSEDANNDSQ